MADREIYESEIYDFVDHAIDPRLAKKIIDLIKEHTADIDRMDSDMRGTIACMGVIALLCTNEELAVRLLEEIYTMRDVLEESRGTTH
tara:strand:+ start:859 stop:1122 length:264 start_codon:yes stop_codon:yes gene_type:complete